MHIDEQDALDRLYAAIQALKRHGCDLPYLIYEVEQAYNGKEEE